MRTTHDGDRAHRNHKGQDLDPLQHSAHLISTPSANLDPIADSGASSNFFPTTASLDNIVDNSGVIFTMASGDTVVNTHTGHLPLGSLPTSACEAHVIPNITPLLSIGQLCDAGCTAVFTNKSIAIKKKKVTIMEGYHDETTNLWHLPIAKTNTQEHLAKYVKHVASPSQLIVFAHATFFSPVFKTMYHAVSKHFIHDFPGVTKVTLKKHWPATMATCLLYTSPSPRDLSTSRMPSSA